MVVFDPVAEHGSSVAELTGQCERCARTVYEAIAGRRYDPATFARDLKATGLIEPTGDSRSGGPGRPAALYRYASAAPAWGAGRRKRVP